MYIHCPRNIQLSYYQKDMDVTVYSPFVCTEQILGNDAICYEAKYVTNGKKETKNIISKLSLEHFEYLITFSERK